METIQIAKPVQTKSQKLVENTANKVIKKLSLSGGMDIVKLRDCYDDIYTEVKKYPPSLLGKIAAANTEKSVGTSLYGVHCCTWLDKYDSGRSLLKSIATTVISAKILDILGGNK